MIEITPDEIIYAERILLPEGIAFDEKERVPFINNFSTIDVQAVPGSGKTTALLAKLLIIEKKLPFADGSGVLVLSHTNSAIANISDKIRQHCPKLFEYPNFIGTIQSFIDTFLAIPHYKSSYYKSPIIIEAPSYLSRINRAFEIQTRALKNDDRNLFNRLWSAKKTSDPFSKMRFGDIDGEVGLLDSVAGKKLEISKPRQHINLPEYTEDEKYHLYKWSLDLKIHVLKSGVMLYDDAYYLAERLISKYPAVRDELNKRFSCIFVDEMQDMNSKQISILDDLFLSEDFKKCFQRIGDTNQSIYGVYDNSAECLWTAEGRPTLPISGTHRFGSVTCSIVEKFGPTAITIVANSNKDCENPKLILYNADRVSEVLPFFARIVSEHKKLKPQLYNEHHPVKAIGWVREHEKGMSLKHYMPDYESKELAVRRNSGPSFWVELQEAIEVSSIRSALSPIYHAISRALLLSARLESSSDEAYLRSSRGFFHFLKGSHTDIFDSLQLSLYDWSVRALEADLDPLFKEIGEYISSKLLPLMNLTYSKSKPYLESQPVGIVISLRKKFNLFKCPDTGLEFEVGTVHSVKGETHSATLYLETTYQSKHESQHLLEQFRGIQLDTSKINSYGISAAKLIYVGFSRPKYLLCFAANVKHFSEDDLNEMKGLGWDIKKDLTEPLPEKAAM